MMPLQAGHVSPLIGSDDKRLKSRQFLLLVAVPGGFREWCTLGMEDVARLVGSGLQPFWNRNSFCLGIIQLSVAAERHQCSDGDSLCS